MTFIMLPYMPGVMARAMLPTTEAILPIPRCTAAKPYFLSHDVTAKTNKPITARSAPPHMQGATPLPRDSGDRNPALLNTASNL